MELAGPVDLQEFIELEPSFENKIIFDRKIMRIIWFLKNGLSSTSDKTCQI